MDKKTLTLNPQLFNDHNLRGTNKHRLGQESNISYPTMIRYIDRPDTVNRFDGKVILAILRDGFGYSIDEISNMKMSEVFAIVKNGSG